VASAQHNQTNMQPSHVSQIFKSGSPYQQYVDDINSSTPKTISPKDTLLEANVDDDTPLTPLFEPTPVFRAHSGADSNYGRSSSNASFSMASGFNPVVQDRLNQYPFVSHTGRTLPTTSNSDFGVSLTRTNTSASDYSDVSRPVNTLSDRGTYSCTYHGCFERFETPQKLQKHKREGHRQANVVPTGETDEHGNLLNTQNGPHTCFRINPSTGKACNLNFSRPYDLTRHEDTIHNAKKMKVRCEYCTEEKTFSRNDALTRHMRVVHPEKNYGQKRRKNAVN